MKIKKSLLKYITVGCVLTCLPDNTFAKENSMDVAISNIVIINSYDTEENAVAQAESSRAKEDIETARELINAMDESAEKEGFQERLNNITPDLSLDRLNSTGNVDIYIKSQNMLLLSLDTNVVTFEEFSGIDEIEKPNAITLSINSSLSYKVQATLLDEIRSATGQTIDKSLLTIKANEEDSYETFTNIGVPVVLLDNMPAGNDKTHGIDLKLGADHAHRADIYRTVIKFEVNQK